MLLTKLLHPPPKGITQLLSIKGTSIRTSIEYIVQTSLQDNTNYA